VAISAHVNIKKCRYLGPHFLQNNSKEAAGGYDKQPIDPGFFLYQ
jgi:hypothetical protein